MILSLFCSLLLFFVISVIHVPVIFSSFNILDVQLYANGTLPIPKRNYQRRYERQFPPGSEYLTLPRMVMFTIFMGEMKYRHLPLLFASMKYNPLVDFVLVNVIENDNDVTRLSDLKAQMNVHNLYIHKQTMQEFRDVINNKLGLDISFNKSWYYKMNDYKPVIAYLYPEYVNSYHRYWGYCDFDLIWGNFSSFSYLFQNSDFVIIAYTAVRGYATFFRNRDIINSLASRNMNYVKLLGNITNFDLDEDGTACDYVIDKGKHSMFSMIMDFVELNSTKDSKYTIDSPNHPEYEFDHQNELGLDKEEVVEWAGSIRWHQGSLKVIHECPEFPPGHEILLFHSRSEDTDFPVSFEKEIYEDMIKYGYLLPSWIPISSRYMSAVPMIKIRKKPRTSMEAIVSYHPYHHLTRIKSNKNLG